MLFFVNPFGNNTEIIGSQSSIGIGIIFFETAVVRYGGTKILFPVGVVNPNNQELETICEEETCFTLEFVRILSVGFEF